MVTCEADEKDLKEPIAELGEDHILMTTDYPHFDSEYAHTVSAIRVRTHITARQKDEILGDNAVKLLNPIGALTVLWEA
jgi:predicted TIM-barrel fold metal-dependent hydrolase